MLAGADRDFPWAVGHIRESFGGALNLSKNLKLLTGLKPSRRKEIQEISNLSSTRDREYRSMAPQKNGFILLPLLATVLFSILTLDGCEKKAQQQGPPPPPDVSYATVEQRDLTEYGDWVATLDGDVTAQITPQVTGYLIRQDYKDGAFVHKGQLLFEIDPRPNQALVDQAKAQLAQAEAQRNLAQINLNRDTPLVQIRGIAKSTLDTETGTLNQAEASVKSYQAALATAQLNLGFTKVYSLIDGVAGVASTQVGNLVTQSTTLTTVSTLNPIRAYFPISEQEYLELAGRIRTGGTMDILRRGVSVPLQLTLANGSIYPKTGRIVFVDRQVDTTTGTIRVAGAFPNPNNLLRPGQYGRIRTVTSVDHNALLVPQRAVTELQGAFQVDLISEGNKIKVQNVVVGAKQGAYWVIKSGVKNGDRLVTEGNDKMRDGITVNPKPDPAIQPFVPDPGMAPSGGTEAGGN
jgi:membrane fusion protein (multidrug efflux system)